MYEASLKACLGSKEALGVAWFRADNALTERLEAEGKGPNRFAPEYSKAIGMRLKEKLRETGVAKGRVRNELLSKVSLIARP